MIDQAKRKVFVDYLQKLIEGDGNREDWLNFIIEHYSDEQLEEVRRNIVRLRIKAGDPEIFPVTEKHKEQLRKWAKELQ
jgi:hypothetical protein